MVRAMRTILGVFLFCACGDKHPVTSPLPVAPPDAAMAVVATDAAVAPPVDKSIELAKGQPAPTEIVVTATDIVWIDEGNGDETGGKIMKLSKAGGQPVELAKDQVVPLGLAVDATTAYWTTRGPSGSMTDVKPTGGVWSVPLAGGKVTALATKRGTPHAIALDATSVYFAEHGLVDSKGATISKVSKRGGGGLTVVHAKEKSPGGIAIDADHIYWATGGTCISENGAPMPSDGSISSMPLKGGAIKVLITGLICPEGISIDSDSIYVAMPDSGKILRIPKTGGPAVTAAQDELGARWVTVDATTIYWANQFTRKVRRQAKSGGGIQTLATMEDPVGVAVDDQFIYFTDSKLGVVKKLPR